MLNSTRIILIASFAALTACSSSSTTSTATTDGGGSDSGLGGVGPISAACVKDTDCMSGLFCSTGDPGGQCLKACAAAADCPAGSSCTEEHKCYKTCATNTDCPRSGYACVDSTNVDMSAGKTCDIAPAATDAGTD